MDKKKKFILIIAVFILISFFSISVFSQDNDSVDKSYFEEMGLEVGVGIFSFSGYGFLMKYWFNKSFSFGFALFPYFDLNYNTYYVNFATEFDYRIKEYDWISPYIYFGFEGNYDDYDKTLLFDTGIGFGIQWMLLKNLDLQIHIGFGLSELSQFVFGGGVALYFAF